MARLDTATERVQVRGTGSFPWLLVLILAATLAMLFWFAWMLFRPGLSHEERRGRMLQEFAAHNAEFAKFASSEVAKTWWQAGLDGLVLLKAELDRQRSAIEEHEALLKSLETSDAGRRLAGSDEAVARYVALRDVPRLPAGDLKTLDDVIARMTGIYQRGLDTEIAVMPDRTLVMRNEDIKAELTKWVDFGANLAALKTLVRDYAERPPADRTLAEAVAAWEAERDRRHAAALAGEQRAQ